jgi:hypothetical protein
LTDEKFVVHVRLLENILQFRARLSAAPSYSLGEQMLVGSEPERVVDFELLGALRACDAIAFMNYQNTLPGSGCHDFIS